MEATKQRKAKNAETARDTTLTFRTAKRIKALTEVAARSQGIKMSAYVEQVLKRSFENVLVDQRDEGEPGVGGERSAVTLSPGRPLATIADELYDDDDYRCLFKRVHGHPWALSHEQIRLYELLQISPKLHPKRHVYDEALIRSHWHELVAVANGNASAESLPIHLFDGADISFALMSEADRVALYRQDRDEFMRRSAEHIKKTKRSIK